MAKGRSPWDQSRRITIDSDMQIPDDSLLERMHRSIWRVSTRRKIQVDTLSCISPRTLTVRHAAQQAALRSQVLGLFFVLWFFSLRYRRQTHALLVGKPLST